MSQLHVSFAVLLFFSSGVASAQQELNLPVVVPERVVETGGPGDVFNRVEKMPEFPGGGKAMFKYLATELKYPEEARDLRIQGAVYVAFTVDTNGSIVDALVMRGIGGGCDEEALRVVNGMPRWEPGMQNGEAVKTKYRMPIRFLLNEDPPEDRRSKRRKRSKD